jgi:hypothetical protein
MAKSAADFLDGLEKKEKAPSSGGAAAFLDDLEKKQPKATKPTAAAFLDAHEEKRPTGLALLKPPASMRETPQQATQRVEAAQAEDRQRRTANAAAAKGAPIATRPKTFAEQEQESEARRAPRKECGLETQSCRNWRRGRSGRRRVSPHLSTD